MPTSFNTSFDDSGDDVIHAIHVTQYAAPINALETAIESKGQPNGLASLDGAGKVPASQLPAAGATNLDALTDVAITSPASGQVIKHNGTQFVNSALAASDIPDLDAAKITSGTLPIARGGTGSTTAAAARTALGTAAASHTHAISDVTNLQTNLDAKQSASEKGANNGYASLDGTGKVPASQLPAVGATNLDALTDVAITSPASGQVIRHNGTQFVNSALSASDIASGAVPVANGGTGATTAANARTNLDVPSNAALTSGLAGKQDTSGKNAANGYAGLDASSKLASSQMSEVMPMTGLSDVTITSPSAGQTVRHNGTSFVNAALTPSDVGAAPASHTHVIADVTNLQTSLDAKQATAEKNAANGYAGLDAGSKLASSQMSEVMPMTGLSDVTITSPASGQTVRYNGTSFVNAALVPSDVGAAPASHTHVISDVTNLQTSLDAKEDKAMKGAANGYAGLDGTVKVPVAQIPSGIPASSIATGSISDAEFGYLDGVTSSIQTQLNNKLTGSGVANRIPYWSGASSLTSGSKFTFSSVTGEVYAGGYLSYQGYFTSTTSQIAFGTSSGTRARFTGSQAYISNIGIYGSSGAVMYRYTSGGSAGEVHHLSSSRKNKLNIQTMESISSKLAQMRPVRFEGTAPPLEGSKDVRFEKAFGLIAEEVAPLFPDLCYQIPGSEDPAGIHYDRIPIYLLAGWQEQQKRIEKLESRLVALEGAKS